jgi:hypothetical protein
MWSRAQIAAWIVLLTSIHAYSGIPPRRIANAEYRFSIAFPGDLRICTAKSGDHPHGYFVLLDPQKTDCNHQPVDSVREIEIWADGNTLFVKTPEEYATSYCHSQIPSAKRFDLRGLAFRGHRSVACAADSNSGSIEVYVVTQAGKWPQPPSAAADSGAPYINYWLNLRTSANHFDRDMTVFRRVLESVRNSHQILGSLMPRRLTDKQKRELTHILTSPRVPHLR